MKIETIMSALIKAYFSHTLGNYKPVRHRQWRAFRDRILKMDERNKMRIAELEAEVYMLTEDLEKESP